MCNKCCIIVLRWYFPKEFGSVAAGSHTENVFFFNKVHFQKVARTKLGISKSSARMSLAYTMPVLAALQFISSKKWIISNHFYSGQIWSLLQEYWVGNIPWMGQQSITVKHPQTHTLTQIQVHVANPLIFTCMRGERKQECPEETCCVATKRTCETPYRE